MKILVTNDDGILAEGLWALVRELKKTAQVVVVAPDREQSAIGAAVTLSQPLRVQRVQSHVPDVEAYAVEGTPSDSVILALEKLVKNEVSLVISGINQGLNVGDDVLISGTVGAALQAYLRGLPALAVSMAKTDGLYLDGAARVAAVLGGQIASNCLPASTFLNVNLPDLPLAQIKGIKVTCLASQSHTESVQEGHDGKRKYYWLIRQKVNRDMDKTTDMWAVEQGNISITPLHYYQDNNHSSLITDSFCSEVLEKLQRNQV